MVVNPLGEVMVEADENEAILYADIGEYTPSIDSSLVNECAARAVNKLRRGSAGQYYSTRKGSADAPDTELLATTRRNLPVTIQRRFDVYADVSAVKP